MALPRLLLLLVRLGNGINPTQASGNAKQSLKQRAATGKETNDA
jgi:hypothetical protein